MKNIIVEKASIKGSQNREGWHVVGALDDGKGPTWGVYHTYSKTAAELIRLLYLYPEGETEEGLKEIAMEIQGWDKAANPKALKRYLKYISGGRPKKEREAGVRA